MTGYNTSSAYKLTNYETAEARARQQLRVVGRRSPKQALAVAFTPKVLSAFAIVVTLLCLIVYNQVQLNEISGEINRLAEDIKVLRAENVKMTSSLEATVSLRSVAEQAQELGLHRLDQYQTEYINLYRDDKIVLAEEPEQKNSMQRATLGIRSFIGGIVEYIAGS